MSLLNLNQKGFAMFIALIVLDLLLVLFLFPGFLLIFSHSIDYVVKLPEFEIKHIKTFFTMNYLFVSNSYVEHHYLWNKQDNQMLLLVGNSKTSIAMLP